MRLLLLTHRWPYPPDKGDRIRAYGLLRELSAHFTVDLLSLHDGRPSPEHLAPVQALTDRCTVIPRGPLANLCGAVAAWTSGRSVTEQSFASPAFAAALESSLRFRRYDAVLAVCSSVAAHMLAEAASGGRLARLDRPPLAVDFVDADSAKWTAYADRGGPLAWLYRREGRLVAELERRLLGRAAVAAAVSQVEVDLLADHDAAVPLVVAPNGVDCEHFAPVSGSAAVPSNVVFVGQMDYPPNAQAAEWFARAVWPSFRQTHPQWQFLIVGRRPAAPVRRLGRLDGVRVTGGVPDVRPYLRDAVVAVPLRIARGIQNKVLEALAAGAPVIASRPAVQGIRAEAGKHLLVADSPADWLAALHRLAERPAEAAALGSRGRQLVCRQYSWSAALGPLVTALREQATARRSLAKRAG